MKKIISIVSALAIVMSVVVSFATVASATTAPSVRIAATEITDWTVDPYKSKKTGFDWSSKGSQYKSYDVAVMFSGLELSSVWSDDANDYNGDYVGTAMNTVTANLSFSTTGERNTDWKYALLSGINSSAASKNAKADMYGYGFISPSAVYPKDEEMTITSSDEFAFYNLIVTVDTTKPLTISFGTVNIEIGDFDDSYDSESEMYNSFGVKAANYTEYKSSNGGVSTGAAVVLGGSSTVDVTSVTISGATAATVGDNVQLSATVLPDNATDKTVTWTKVSGNGAVSDSGVVTATAAGNVVVKATAGGVDSANYTVSFAAAAPADIVPEAADQDTYSSASVGLHDASGTPVTIDSSRSYGAAKFENVILDNGEYVYKIFATGINKTSGLEETHSWDVVNEKLEIAEDVSVSFIAIVRSATHTITSVVLKAFAKSE